MTSGLDERTIVFESHRSRLFGIAYRMTGSVGDAEDACQDAWLRWSAVDLDLVDNAEAFLVSVVTRLGIDRARSAAKRRETYVGPSVAEPLVERDSPVGGTSPILQPEQAAELADSLTLAFLVLLDQLSPTERAVFLLHDVFGCPFQQVAEAVGQSPAAVRQMASRARRRIDSERVDLRRGRSPDDEQIIAGLLVAITSGDIEATMRFLAPDIVQLDDGGSLVRAGQAQSSQASRRIFPQEPSARFPAVHGPPSADETAR